MNCCEVNKNIDEIFKEYSIVKTKSKKEILAVLIDSKVPLSAKNILTKLKKYNESTVFRNLNQFNDLRIIQKIDMDSTESFYQTNFTDHHHHFAKCTECGDLIEMNKCNLDIYKKELKKKGFFITGHKIAFTGLCESCF